MPENDEPLDDARAVAMTAGAAAARVVETVVREQQNRAQQAAHETQQRQQAQSAVAAVKPYDSPERRAEDDQAMRTAGVPDEIRHAKTTADLMNGTDPATAAATGAQTPSKPARVTRQPVRERTR